MLGISAALGAKLDQRDIVLVKLLLAVLLLDLPLDRKPVAVPAGNIRRVLAQQGLGADDHVLQHLVERMADVDVAIGVRRPVVKDEFLAARPRPTELTIKVIRLPFGKDRRLFLRQAGLHRKVGLRQEDGGSVIGFFGRVGHCGGP